MMRTLSILWASIGDRLPQIIGHLALGAIMFYVTDDGWEALLIAPVALLAYLALCKMWDPTDDAEYACFFVLAEDRERLSAMMAKDISEETGLPVRVISVTKEQADELEEALDDKLS